MYNMYGAAPDYSHPNLGYNLFSPAPAKQQRLYIKNCVKNYFRLAKSQVHISL